LKRKQGLNTKIRNYPLRLYKEMDYDGKSDNHAVITPVATARRRNSLVKKTHICS
jgi:hypothetical protein